MGVHAGRSTCPDSDRNQLIPFVQLFLVQESWAFFLQRSTLLFFLDLLNHINPEAADPRWSPHGHPVVTPWSPRGGPSKPWIFK